MGEAIGWAAVMTVAGAIAFAVLARMAAQIIKDNGRERKVTECIASLNMLMVHIAVYDAATEKSSEEANAINRMIDAWNQRYGRWRGFERIPNLHGG